MATNSYVTDEIRELFDTTFSQMAHIDEHVATVLTTGWIHIVTYTTAVWLVWLITLRGFGLDTGFIHYGDYNYTDYNY
jgi:hypothetical protein